MFRRRHFVLRSPFPCELLLCGTGSVDDGCSSCSSSSTGSPGVLEKSGSGIETSGCSGTVRPHLVHVGRLGWLLRQFGFTNHMIHVLIGFSHYLLVQVLSFRHMRQLFSRLLEDASATVNIVVTLTSLRHHGGDARTPTRCVSSEVTQVSRFKCQPVRTRGRDCGPAKALIRVHSNESTAGCISDTNRTREFIVLAFWDILVKNVIFVLIIDHERLRDSRLCGKHPL